MAFCGKCGATLKDNGKSFCHACGSPVARAAAPKPPVAQQSPVASNQHTVPRQTQPPAAPPRHIEPQQIQPPNRKSGNVALIGVLAGVAALVIITVLYLNADKLKSLLGKGDTAAGVETAETTEDQVDTEAENEKESEEPWDVNLAYVETDGEEDATVAGATAEREAEDGAVAEARAKREAEEKAVAEARAKREAEENAAVAARAKREAEEKAAAEAQARAKREAEEKAAAEVRAKREAEEKAAAEAQIRAKRKAEENAAAEAQARREAEDRAAYEARAAREAETRAAAKPSSVRITLSPGKSFSVITSSEISTSAYETGNTFEAILNENITDGSRIIAERGSVVRGVISDSDPGGRVKGVATMSLQIEKLTLVDGREVPVKTDTHTVEADSSVGKDAAKVGIGAGIGAAIGGIIGGGRGAAIGAGVGGAGGTATVLATRGNPAVVAGETTITFRLTSPLDITLNDGGRR